MAVRRTHHAELVRVGPKLPFQGEAQLQSLARILPLQHVGCLEGSQIEIALVPRSVVGELIVGRQSRMCLSVTFDLRSHWARNRT